jgi:phosphopentomutase
VYRYIDARLEVLHDALDADDVLVVMSDHGIRTAMQHSRDAIFVATGAGVPHGRAPGRPALRGVSRAVADLLAVETDWPDTGVAPWAEALARATGSAGGS